jgi:tetratricopeptide (TPR) repeat protein
MPDEPGRAHREERNFPFPVGDRAASGPSGDGPNAETANARPFVGRARELQQLTWAVDAACSGHGSLVLVSGEPGIGKSRLIEEIADAARARGCRVLTGRCWDGGGAPAYWPWVQIVRSAGADFEELALPLSPESSSRSSVADVVDPAAARFRLFDQVASFLSEQMKTAPLQVVIDDLHAADEPSMHLLRFVATSVADQPMLLVASYRDVEPRVREAADLFGELSRLGRRVPLAGLTRSEIARYIEIVTGRPSVAGWVERVHELTAGNPFFVGEVVRADAEQRPGDERHRLPEEVRALIRRRVSYLSPETAGMLHTASVLGRNFELRVLDQTTTLSTERVIDVLGEAEEAGIVSADPDAPGSYAFAHDLLREAMYEDLPPTRRMELHRMAGRVLERAFTADPESHLSAIAHHFVQSAPLGDEGVAIDFSIRAGDRAARLLAYEDAATHYEHALQLLPSEAFEQRYEVLLRLGDALARSAATEAAKRSFEDAAALARRLERAELLARAAFGYVTSAEPVRLGFGGLLVTAMFEEGSTGIALLEEALDALPDEDTPLRARVLARLATALYPMPHSERPFGLAQEAFDMALRLGEPEALVEGLHAQHWATLRPDSVHDRLANAQQTLLVAAGAGGQEAAFLARHARFHCYLELLDGAGVDAELAAMEQLAGRIRQPFYTWHVTCLRAIRTLLHGSHADAERQMRDAAETGRLRTSEHVKYMYEYAQMVCIRWTQGRFDEVSDQVRMHGERFRSVARWRDSLLAAEIGDRTAARAEIERHAQGAFRDLPRDGLWLLHLSALAQACVLLADRPRAEALYELLLPFSDRNAISISTMPFGPVAMRLGMLAGLLERWDEVDPHFDKAVELCGRLDARAIKARVMLEHARVLVLRDADGDRGRAVDLLHESGDLCEQLDLSGIADRVASALGDVQIAPTTAQPGAMFRREGQVWTVAYAGRMSRLHELRGFRYIADLLASPGREIYVLDLLTAHVGPTDRDAGTRELDRGGTSPEPILDARAKEEYRNRLRELARELDEARSWHDPERVLKLEAEVEAITDELEHATGLGGRDRQMLSPAERARVSVTKAIKAAIRTIAKECPPLADHLGASIRTGRFCSYAPPGQEPPRWDL